MPSITEAASAPAKILLIGKSGAGKTGSLASLVASGYNLRIIDTDKGVAPLYSLLTDHHYPYAHIIAAKGIDISKAVYYQPIDTTMRSRIVIKKMPDGKTTTEALLAPMDGKAWGKATDLFSSWKEGDQDLGPVSSWGPMDVLVIDSFSTLAKCAYYFSQSMNNRLGARDVGHDYRRDVGEAQSQLTRVLEFVYDSGITCNVVIISHITWVDESKGVASLPRTSTDEKGNEMLSEPDGYPSAIGRALSPQIGKYFNNAYIVYDRRISTVPRDNIAAKNSVYLDREYPIAYGLAEIFAKLRNLPSPTDLIEACKPKVAAPTGSTVGSASTLIRPKSSVSA